MESIWLGTLLLIEQKIAFFLWYQMNLSVGFIIYYLLFIRPAVCICFEVLGSGTVVVNSFLITLCKAFTTMYQMVGVIGPP